MVHANDNTAPAMPASWRTAAEAWLAGETVQRPRRSAYKKASRPSTVAVTFADGVVIRSSTYLPGEDGIADAVRFARTVRQSTKLSQVERLRRRAMRLQDEAPQWVHTPKGWRLVTYRACPDVVSARYVEPIGSAVRDVA